MQAKLMEMTERSNAVWTLYMKNGPHVERVMARILPSLGKESILSRTFDMERFKSKSHGVQDEIYN
jgi:hypothetical protein